MLLSYSSDSEAFGLTGSRDGKEHKMKGLSKRNSITGGLFFVGLGILVLTGWWWPGIAVVLGLALASGLALRGYHVLGLAAAVFLVSFPFVVSTDIAPAIFGSMTLVGLATAALANSCNPSSWA